MKNCKAERRKHPRLKTHLLFELEQDTVSITTQMMDLSCAGVYCRLQNSLPLMSKVVITMFLPRISSNGAFVNRKDGPFLKISPLNESGEPACARKGIPVDKKNKESLSFKIKCEGAVVRSEPTVLSDTSCAHYNIAIFFTDLAEADRRLIAQYVEDSLSEGAKKVFF